MTPIEWYFTALFVCTIAAFVIAILLYSRGHRYLDWKNEYGDVIHCYRCNRDLPESELTRTTIVKPYGKYVDEYEYIHAMCHKCGAMQNYSNEPIGGLP